MNWKIGKIIRINYGSEHDRLITITNVVYVFLGRIDEGFHPIDHPQNPLAFFFG